MCGLHPGNEYFFVIVLGNYVALVKNERIGTWKREGECMLITTFDNQMGVVLLLTVARKSISVNYHRCKSVCTEKYD